MVIVDVQMVMSRLLEVRERACIQRLSRYIGRVIWDIKVETVIHPSDVE